MLPEVERQPEVSDLRLTVAKELTPRFFRAREALRACLPEPLRDNTFSALLKVCGYASFLRRFSPHTPQGDMVTKRCLTTLLNNLSEPTVH